jgi:hypothetical protein
MDAVCALATFYDGKQLRFRVEVVLATGVRAER